MKFASAKKNLFKVVLIVGAFIGFWSPQRLFSQGPVHNNAPSSEWRPTDEPSAGARYVGEPACAQCHADKVATHQRTGMAQALERAADSLILRTHPKLNFKSGSYSYQILRQGNQILYTVTNGVDTVSAPVLWAFGHGEMGQTYVFQHNNVLYESRISFYSRIKNLDFTLGAPRTAPSSLMEAAGREMKADDVKDCFGCHATNVVSGSRVHLDKLTPGIRCEACHGPAEKHVVAMKTGNFKEKGIANLRALSTEEQSNFCGACHRTWDQVMLLPGRGGIDNVRFQPYRLTNSRCYDTEDRRISCTACHNPHEELKRVPAAYDSKCMACHVANSSSLKTAQASTRPASPCPVETKNCVTCHMQKIELPGAHFKFTDHHIRVVRPNDRVPL